MNLWYFICRFVFLFWKLSEKSHFKQKLEFIMLKIIIVAWSKAILKINYIAVVKTCIIFLAWSKAFNNFFNFSCQNMYCTCIILSHLWLFLYLLTGMFVLHLSLDVFEFPLNTFGHPIIVKVFFLLHEF